MWRYTLYLYCLCLTHSLLRGFRSVSISSLKKLPKVILIIVFDRNSLVSYSDNRMSIIRIPAEYVTFFEIVVGMIVNRINLFRLSVQFHKSNAIFFKWSDQFSKFHNRWGYHALLKLSVVIHPRHSSWSVPSRSKSSCRIPFSGTFRNPIFDDTFSL